MQELLRTAEQTVVTPCCQSCPISRTAKCDSFINNWPRRAAQSSAVLADRRRQSSHTAIDPTNHGQWTHWTRASAPSGFPGGLLLSRKDERATSAYAGRRIFFVFNLIFISGRRNSVGAPTRKEVTSLALQALWMM